jgi:anti-sigma regulatory factor (Ser/Thr protein kinase)
MTEPPALELSIAADLPSLEQARLQVLAYLGHWNGIVRHPRTVYAIELVLEEWLSNVFRHGTASRVKVKVSVQPERIELRFEDDGPPFDPTERPQTALPPSLDEARPGGLGLFLIQHYAHAWRYARDSGRNVMRVWLHRPPD